MAVLSDNDRRALWAELMQEMSAGGEPCLITKVQLRAALDAADVWADGNAASYNSALPTAARNNLTGRQKARLLAFVIRRRWEVS